MLGLVWPILGHIQICTERNINWKTIDNHYHSCHLRANYHLRVNLVSFVPKKELPMYNGFLRFISGAPPAILFIVSMAAKLFWPTLWTSIGGTWTRDRVCGTMYDLTVWGTVFKLFFLEKIASIYRNRRVTNFPSWMMCMDWRSCEVLFNFLSSKNRWMWKF